MKTKEEIKKEAEERFWKWNGKDYMDNEITHLEKSKYVSGYLGGYTQCQEDMAHDLKVTMEKQTAVSWLIKELYEYEKQSGNSLTFAQMKSLLEQAKEMEKEQLKEKYHIGFYKGSLPMGKEI